MFYTHQRFSIVLKINKIVCIIIVSNALTLILITNTSIQIIHINSQDIISYKYLNKNSVIIVKKEKKN